MNRSRETSTGTDGKASDGQRDGAAELVEIELDHKELRAMVPPTDRSQRSLDDAAPLSRNLIDTATNLELSQSLDDLRNLSWPGVTIRKPDK